MKKAFTLVEIIVAVIVVGIIAGLAFPKMIDDREKGFFMQAASSIRAYQAAENTYFLDHGSYAPTCGDLEITSTMADFAVACDAVTGDVTLTRSGNLYTVSISPNGSPVCSNPKYQKLLQ